MAPNTIYPPLGQPGFGQALMRGKNYRTLAIPEMEPVLNEKQFEKKAKEYCEGYEKFLYQYIAQQHLSPFSPYRGILLYHGLGFGKTCSAITYAEALLNHQVGLEIPPKSVWVITSAALEDNFKSQLHRPGAAGAGACMGTAYDSLGGMAAVEARYTFFTYDKFGSLVKEKQDTHTLKAWAKDRVLIIDEAHNLRNSAIRGAIGLEAFLKAGSNNRLVLLSATPMFDRPDELIQLLYYLVLNDRRTDLPLTPKAIKGTSFYVRAQNKQGDADASDAGDEDEHAATLNPTFMPVFRQLCANYISYVKGTNPFNLAARLRPTASGLPVLTAATVPKIGYFSGDTGDAAATAGNGRWLRWIPDGLLATEMSPLQSERLYHLSFVKETVKTKLARVVGDGKEPLLIHTNVLEGTNVIYPGGTAKKPKYLVGNDGFQSILKPVMHAKTGKLLYYDYYGAPYLHPSAGYLKTYAAKLYRTAELLQQSRGIVLIYSHFIWSGVMPMAMVLEHLGYGRYKDTNLLRAGAGNDIATDLPKTPGRSYAIFCSDPGISGVDSFQALLDDINAPDNMQGEKIKVILMSPVASEGISFKHVREVHVLDPWFHLNRLEQVIGRSIRTCSHQALPLAERNVSVFLHVSQYAPTVAESKNKETYDLYTYRIASDKKEKMTEIETVIRDHALDCSLQTHVNYYPTRKFPFKLRMLTSQGVETFVSLGDTEDKAPRCAAAATTETRASRRSWRRESYAPLKEIAKERLRKIIIAGKSLNHFSWDTASLLEQIRLPTEVGWLGLEALRDEGVRVAGVPHRVVFHRLKVWVVPETADATGAPRKLALLPVRPTEEKGKGKDKETKGTVASECEELVEMMMQYDVSDMANDTVAMVSFLTILNVDCWEPFAKRIVAEGVVSRLTEVLWKHGWLISTEELGGASTSNAPRYSGYAVLDLMKKETDMVVRVQVRERDDWRDTTKAEMQRVLAGRRRVGEMAAPFGFYALHQREGQPTVFKFKLIQDTGNPKRDKTGIVATTLPTKVLRDWIDRLRAMFPRGEPPIAPNFEVKDNRTNRTYLSSWIAYYLGMLGRLRIPPVYKIGDIV